MTDNTNLSAGANSSSEKHIRGSSFLLAGRMISIIVNFAVQVLTVRYLSKTDYGALAYGLSIASLGSSIAVFGLDKTITRFVPIYEEKKEYGKVIGTLVLMVSTILSIGFFLILVLYGFQAQILSSLVNDSLAFSLLLILVFLAPINALDSLLVGTFAIFANPRTIFIRRYLIGPGLKISVIVISMLLKSNVYFLAWGYLVAGLIGVSFYVVVLAQLFSNIDYFRNFDWKQFKIPAKEIFSFSIPLLTTDAVFLIRHNLIVFMLEYFRGVSDVASFRAVLPVARINLVVIQSFTFLFMPMAARMFANDDREGINGLYWQSAVWISLITFPIFLMTFGLAEPLTVLLFGNEYANSALVMMLLSFGYYFNAILGFNADTLRVYGRVRYIVMMDVAAAIISLSLNLWLIPQFGAIGGAIGTCATLVIHNLLNHIGLQIGTSVNLFQMRYLKVYVSILLGTLIVWGFQYMLHPHFAIGMVLAALVSLVVIYVNRVELNIISTFPELMKIKVLRGFLQFIHFVPETSAVEN